MSDILLDTQVPPATPGANKAKLYFDSVTKMPTTRNDTGQIDTLGPLTNGSVAAQGPGFATDTYLTGSSIALMSLSPRVRTIYQCTFDASKTAAGTATPLLRVRFGTAGAVGDAQILLFTFPAATAIADVGTFTVWASFRTVGAAGVLQGRANLVHKGTATGLTGFSIEPGPTVQVTSGGFDTTVANSFIGLSVNGGTSAAWTVQLVEAMVVNL